MRKIPKTWSEAIIWLFYNLTGILIPIGLSILVLLAMKLSFSLTAITHGGQFAIYSVAMSTTTIYLIAKPNPKRLPYTEFFGLLCILTWACAIAIFILAILYTNGVNIATWFVEWPSIAIFIICIIVTFFATIADNRRTEMGQKDLISQDQAAFDSLSKDFDKTEEEGSSNE